MEKTRITEIRETYTSRQRVRNANGEFEFRDLVLTRFKEVKYVEGWARFGGFLLDVVFILIFEVLVDVVIILFCVMLGIDNFLGDDNNTLLNLLIVLLIRSSFYILFEGLFQATPAKMILGRVVVNEFGEKPPFMTMVGRAYARFVPFEVFSCLATLGWHDQWTNTFVLRKKDLYDLQMALKVYEFDKQEPDPMRAQLL